MASRSGKQKQVCWYWDTQQMEYSFGCIQ